MRLPIQISLYDEGPLLEMLEFFAINQTSYQPLNVFPYYTLSTQYIFLMSIITRYEHKQFKHAH